MAITENSYSIMGQWQGRSSQGSYCLVNVNQRANSIDGHISVYETAAIGAEHQSLWAWSYFSGTVDSNNSFHAESTQPFLYWPNGNQLTNDEWADLSKRSGIEFPLKTEIHGKISSQFKMTVSWKSHFPSAPERKDSVVLRKAKPGISSVSHESMSWEQFRSYALNQGPGVIFRGQAKPWRLQTSYHRHGHADLIDYFDRKIPEVERHISATSSQIYNVHDDRSLGALLNLAQHHGYPTPLLDWTKSPYVAAFFAYESLANVASEGEVSIFVFDEGSYASLAGRVAQIRVPRPLVITMELPGHGNARVLPQQSITMYSNMDDIEGVIRNNEKTPGQYLKAISLPVASRETAMQDLQLMGITWGSMFPGLDGVCRQLAYRHFEAMFG